MQKIQKKKSLGQHFLNAPTYLRAMADAASIQPGEYVLEIGPGEGALTRELLARGAVVVTVEKDHRLISILEEMFAEEIENKKLFVHEGDALEVDVEKILGEKEFKLVANIPYYITGALLRKFLSEEKMQPSTLVFLVQKEVAERVAKSAKESILSLSVKVYGDVKYIKMVPRGAFSPPPDVDSAILAVTNISRDNFTTKTLSGKVRPTPQEAASREKKFFTVLKSGFAQKRKMLKKNITGVFGKGTEAAMQNAGIAETARAEDVPLEKWLALSEH